VRWDTVERDLYILSAQLRSVIRHIDSLQRELKRERDNGTLAVRRADAVERAVENKSDWAQPNLFD